MVPAEASFCGESSIPYLDEGMGCMSVSILSSKWMR
jgi:hypothetical protein